MFLRLSMPSSRLVTPPLVVLCGLVTLAGIFLRFWDLGFPDQLTWDEHHFVENARNYLQGKPDWNDHPPLGKLFMMACMGELGDSFFAARLPSALLGSLSVVWAGLLALSLFRNRAAALLAATFVALDGFFLAYSKTALLDGMLTSLSLLALLLITLRGWLAVLAAGLAIGLSLSLKMSGVALFGPFLAVALLKACLLFRPSWVPLSEEARQRFLPRSKAELLAYPVAGLLALLTYLSVWSVGLHFAGQENTFAAGVRRTQELLEHHAKLTDWKHPLLSRWYTWFIPTKPIVLRNIAAGDGTQRVMTSMGNPVLWWAVSLTVFSSLGTLVQKLRSRRELDLPRAFLLLTFIAYLLPWIVTNRDSYFYHYLPAYACGVVLTAGALCEFFESGRFSLSDRGARSCLLAVSVITLVSAFFAPVWAQVPVGADAWQLKLLLGR